MASIFKMKNRPNLMVAWVDASGKRRIRSSGTTERRVAERFAKEMEKQEILIRGGLVDPHAERLAAAARKPLSDHVESFLRYLRDKGDGEKHLSDREGQLDRLLQTGRMKRLADLTPARVQSALAQLREVRSISITTQNRYLRAIRGLTRWLVRERLLESDPLLGMSGKNPASDRRHERRALTPEEVRKLLVAADAGSEHRGLHGRDRGVLYRVALGTGFRASELASLTPASFHLDQDPPIIVVEPGYSKNRKPTRQPIRRDLADPLHTWLDGMPTDRPVFDVPHLHHRTARMMRFDLAAAGIPYLDAEGKVADFHSLRVTYISALVGSGASVKEAQLLARHSDPGLTIQIYTRTSLLDLGRVLNSMPETPVTTPEKSHRTRGTCV